MDPTKTFILDHSLFGFVYKILTPLVWLMTYIINAIHSVLVAVGMSSIGLSWILSIILLVVFIHLFLFPLFIRQIRGMQKMQSIQPQMRKIQKKYKGKKDSASREAMSREMMKLQRENGASYMGSCLPMLVQGPVFMCMFYMLSVASFIANGKHAPIGAFTQSVTKDFAQTVFLGVPVTTVFFHGNIHQKIVIAIFVALMCAAMWYMQFNNMRKNLPQEMMEGPQYKTQKMMTWMFPIMYIFSGVSMPFATLIYWLTNNIINMLRSLWQVYAYPTEGSQAAQAKIERDHTRENNRRAKNNLPSLEEEELNKARVLEQERAENGFQRVQPKRKKK